MKVMSQFLLFVSFVFTLQTHAQGFNSEIVHLNITSRVGHTYLGMQSDGTIAAIVCTTGWTGLWTADLVFPVKQPDSEVPELTLESYKGSRLAATNSRSPYLPLTSKAASLVCSDKAEAYVLVRVGRQMKVSKLVGARVSEDEKKRLEAAAED